MLMCVCVCGVASSAGVLVAAIGEIVAECAALGEHPGCCASSNVTFMLAVGIFSGVRVLTILAVNCQVWGPMAWWTLHTMSIHYPESVRPVVVVVMW